MFFSRVTQCCNPSTVKLKTIKTISTGKLTNFTGDSLREVDKIYEFGCFYMRNISDKQREKMGVTQDTTDVVYISPLELERKTGDVLFPDYVRSNYSRIAVEFIGAYYEILNIIDLEPMFNGKVYVCMAYQLNLKKTIGNTDIN